MTRDAVWTTPTSDPRMTHDRPPNNLSAAPQTGTSGDTGVVRLDHEPWVQLADGEALANWSASDEIRYNQQNRQSGKLGFFRQVFDFLKENEIAGDYHEYGCHRGRTFRMALTEARRENLHDMKFWAFDSFAGLPEPASETSVGKWKQGALATSEQEFLRLISEHGIYASQVRTVKGLYSDALTADRQRSFLDGERRIALATIDCDLYESAIPVFDFIEPLLQPGSVLYIDDLFVGNRGDPRRGLARAFVEFRKRSRWGFVRHLDVGWWGRSYIATDGDSGGGDVI
jgi:Macrocin-O-methyltransferase (TylF)